MGRISINAALIFGSLLTASIACAASYGHSANLDQAIADYNNRDYRAAIAKLNTADQKNSLVHYYLAMSYQSIGSFEEAEKQYSWVYRNTKDNRLRAQSLQGLQALSNVKLNAVQVASSDGGNSNDSKSAVPKALAKFSKPFYHDAHGNPVSSDPGKWFNMEWRPGCPRHTSQ